MNGEGEPVGRAEHTQPGINPAGSEVESEVPSRPRAGSAQLIVSPEPSVQGGYRRGGIRAHAGVVTPPAHGCTSEVI